MDYILEIFGGVSDKDRQLVNQTKQEAYQLFVNTLGHYLKLNRIVPASFNMNNVEKMILDTIIISKFRRLKVKLQFKLKNQLCIFGYDIEKGSAKVVENNEFLQVQHVLGSFEVKFAKKKMTVELPGPDTRFVTETEFAVLQREYPNMIKELTDAFKQMKYKGIVYEPMGIYKQDDSAFVAIMATNGKVAAMFAGLVINGSYQGLVQLG